jgi:hypothetical protein
LAFQVVKALSDVLSTNNKIQRRQQNTATTSRRKAPATTRNNGTTAMVNVAKTADARSKNSKKGEAAKSQGSAIVFVL